MKDIETKRLEAEERQRRYLESRPSELLRRKRGRKETAFLQRCDPAKPVGSQENRRWARRLASL